MIYFGLGPKLVGVNHTAERRSVDLPMTCLGQEVVILREEGPAELACAVKQFRVGCARTEIFGGAVDVFLHVFGAQQK